jgi:hypothetical protein
MAKLLDFMLRCNNASEDDIVEDLVKMADPNSFDSKDEMESHFEDCLGYNPIDYFDRKTIDEKFDDIIKNAPYSVQEQLRDKREEIIERTLECSDDIGESVLHKVFITVIKDTVGWQPSYDGEVSLDDCISMAIFGNDDSWEDYNNEDDIDDDDDDEAEEEDLILEEDDDEDYMID